MVNLIKGIILKCLRMTRTELKNTNKKYVISNNNNSRLYATNSKFICRLYQFAYNEESTNESPEDFCHITQKN